MPFVNEQISEQDKARINWKEFKYWGGDVRGFLNPSWWTIDRSRDVFFVQLNSGGVPDRGPPPTYGLCWKGHFVRVVTKGPSVWSQKDSGAWEIVEVNVPVHLEPNRQEILEVLKEAISAFGWNYNGAAFQPREIKIVNLGRIGISKAHSTFRRRRNASSLCGKPPCTRLRACWILPTP